MIIRGNVAFAQTFTILADDTRNVSKDDVCFQYIYIYVDTYLTATVTHSERL